MADGATTSTGLRFGWGLSSASDASTAAASAAEQAAPNVHQSGDAGVDVVFVFACGPHLERLPWIAEDLQRRLGARHVLAAGCASLLGGREEVEHGPAVSMLAARLPGVRLTPFGSDALAQSHDLGDEASGSITRALAMDAELRACLLICDPFSVPMQRLLPRLNGLRAAGEDGEPAGVIVGGLASGGRKAGENVLLVDGRVQRDGVVGMSVSGPVRVDALVSQGCRPIGGDLVVTRAKGNLVFELGGRPALSAAKAALDALGEDDRKLLNGGLWLGRAANASKPRLGRGDYLIRQVMGAEQSSGALAVSDLVRAGQTVRFHLRDRVTAREDLELLLDGQVLHGRPAGALMFTCNGRGEGLFGERHVDAWTVQRAFLPRDGGEQAAKAGRAIDPARRHLVPLAGMFAAGEIGPVGDESYLHGQTACVAMFREAERASGADGDGEAGD